MSGDATTRVAARIAGAGKTAADRVRLLPGVAVADSADGWVDVLIDDETWPASDKTGRVREGDKVTIALQANTRRVLSNNTRDSVPPTPIGSAPAAVAATPATTSASSATSSASGGTKSGTAAGCVSYGEKGYSTAGFTTQDWDIMNYGQDIAWHTRDNAIHINQLRDASNATTTALTQVRNAANTTADTLSAVRTASNTTSATVAELKTKVNELTALVDQMRAILIEHGLAKEL